MVFTALVAADVHGDKQNLELQFPHQPSLPELETCIVTTYCQQFPGLRFSLTRIQLYDEVVNRWTDLVSGQQLRDFAQLYAFNREAVEVQKAIPPPTRPARPPLPEAATHEEKTRAVFEELDVNNNRVIENEEFKRGFRVLNFEFTPATVQDLFEKASAGEGHISYTNWGKFAEVYPTMLDSLYFRCRDYWEDFRQKQGVKAAEDELEARRQAEEQARNAHKDDGDATQQQQQRLVAAEEAIAAAVNAERDAKQALVDGQRGLDTALRDRQQRQQDLEVAREADRQRGIAVLEAQRDVDRSEQAKAWQVAEQQKQADKERQARNVAEEARQEVERQERVQNEAAEYLAETKQRQEAAEDALRDERAATEGIGTDLNQREMDVQAAVAKERELDLRGKEVAAAAERERVRRDDEDRALQAAREREQQEQAALLDAQRAVEEMEKRLQEQKDAREAARERRKGIEEREEPILEQEVRLREQRDALEEKEAKLRTEATAFHGVRGNAATGGGGVYGASPARRGY